MYAFFGIFSKIGRKYSLFMLILQISFKKYLLLTIQIRNDYEKKSTYIHLVAILHLGNSTK